MAVIPKPYGNASYQLVDHGIVVGLILQTPEVQWGVYDLNRNRIGRLSFDDEQHIWSPQLFDASPRRNSPFIQFNSGPGKTREDFLFMTSRQTR